MVNHHKLVLSSANPHKLAELRHALPSWEVELLAPLAAPLAASLAASPGDLPPETGATYAENAGAKARFGRAHAPHEAWAVGEDSGIEVAALGGRPGIASARWAADGVAQLLRELEGVADRRARYVCHLVAIAPDGREVAVEGVLDGSITTGPPRGTEGFGYDPIFVPAGESETVAELGNEWKRGHSHRARAAAALAAAAREDLC